MPGERAIPLGIILALHVKETVDRKCVYLNNFNKKVLSWHSKYWWRSYCGQKEGYASPIEHSLHYLSLKYRDKCFSGLIEDVEPEAKIFKLENQFSCALMTKLLLIRKPQSSGQVLYQLYDGSHRLAYLRYYGLKAIPRCRVHIADHEKELVPLLPASCKVQQEK